MQIHRHTHKIITYIVAALVGSKPFPSQPPHAEKEGAETWQVGTIKLPGSIRDRKRTNVVDVVGDSQATLFAFAHCGKPCVQGPGPSVQNMQDQKPWTVPEFTGSEECCLCCSRVQWLCSCMFICCCKPFQIIQSYENGVVLRYGKRLHEKTLGGGMHIILPSADQLLKIDIREQVMDLPKQQCLSREGVNLTVDGVIYYKVFDANRALLGVQNVRDALKNMALTKVRETVATHTVDQINLERQTLADNLTKALDTEAERWGIDVTKLLLTGDLRI